MDEVTTDLAPHARRRSIQGWLREETASVHAAVEHTVMLALAPLSRARYGLYLERVHALYDALEPELWNACAERVPDHALRRSKARWLRDDLAALGFERQAHHGNRPAALPPLGDPLHALGAAYVVEGATLGGPVLLSRLRGAGVLDPLRTEGTRFLTGYGPSNAVMWQGFRAALQGAAEAADWTPLRTGALAMFRAYEAALAETSAR